MNRVRIRMGGVPEHYTLPIHLGREQAIFSRWGIDLEWTNFEGGTGQMTQALRRDEVDICVLLTEGIIADIIKGNPSKIISGYVLTPLTWGIHTGIDSPLDDHSAIYDQQYAVSRWGSGSHLMAIVDAESAGHRLKKEQFTVVNDIDGALRTLDTGETTVFYWEKYTTKHYVDTGRLKRIGEYRTPWPCFVIAASDAALEKYPRHITRMLRLIHDQCNQFMRSKRAVAILANRYQLHIEDAERWFNSTKWGSDAQVPDKVINQVIHYLKTADIIAENQPIPELTWELGS